MIPSIGQIVTYRSFLGDEWEAKVTAVRPAGTRTFVDIFIEREELELTRIRWQPEKTNEPHARPRS